MYSVQRARVNAAPQKSVEKVPSALWTLRGGRRNPCAKRHKQQKPVASAAGLHSIVNKLEGERTKLQLGQLQVGLLIDHNVPPLAIVQIQHAQRFMYSRQRVDSHAVIIHA